MGFYSANTPEQKRVKKLTGDINISDMFKNDYCMKWNRKSFMV